MCLSFLDISISTETNNNESKYKAKKSQTQIQRNHDWICMVHSASLPPYTHLFIYFETYMHKMLTEGFNP